MMAHRPVLKRVLKWGAVLYIAQAAVGIALGLGLGIYVASLCGAGDLTCVQREIETWIS